MDYATSFGRIIPELLLTGSGLVLLMIAAFGGEKASRLVSILAAVAIGAAGCLVIPTLANGVEGEAATAFYGQISADSFSAFAKLLVYLAAIGCLMIAPGFFTQRRAMKPEYPVLVLFATLGMSIMVSATDLMTLYIGLELNSLAAYVLASFLRNDSRSAEAGLK
jgi:NADH-quinone oxidoreductase subunit N